MKNIPKPIITREHGSWAVLFVPIIIGAVQAGSYSWNILWFTLSASGVFLSYVPAQTLLRERIGISKKSQKDASSRFWFSAYFAFSVICFTPLLIQQLWLLLMIAFLAVGLFLAHFFLIQESPNSIAADFMAVAGLTLGAPGAYYVSTGRVDTSILIIWFLSTLYFGCSVFYVHLKIKFKRMRINSLSMREKLRLGKRNIVYQSITIVTVTILILCHLVSPAVLIAFIPMVFHSVIGTIRLDRPVNFKHLGYLLLIQSVVFTAIFTWTR